MMKDRKIEAFDATVLASHEWVHAYGELLGQTHPPLAYRCLRVALHTIRDRLPVEEAVALAAQLPMLLRGVYYEGWRPSQTPLRMHTPDEMYARVSRELEGGLGAPPRDVMRAAFELLNRRIDAGEVAKVRRLFPEALRAIWPAPAGRAGAPTAQPTPR